MLLQTDPSLPPCLYAGFEAAKAQVLKKLGEGSDLSADAAALAKRRSIVGDDPLPNGPARNRKALEPIVGSHTSRRSCLDSSTRGDVRGQHTEVGVAAKCH
jgi:hypothetical protein